MKRNIDTETAEAGFMILLDPAGKTETEGAEYFYLGSSDAGQAANTHDSRSADFEVPQTLDSNSAAEGSSSSLKDSKDPIVLKASPLPIIEGTAKTTTASRPQYEGFHIAHYHVERAIGRGGMGDVYLAKDLRLGRPVAIKLLRADFQPTSERVERIEREARAVCALNHPNIVTIYEIGEVEGAPYIVSEFIEGDTLRQILPPNGMRVEQALEITIQIANALASAHQMGIIHRDIKPENVMVRSDGYVKVLDFGLAKLSDAIEDGGMRGSVSDVVLGTVSYMSPEQARGGAVDLRSDIFSLGIVLYELITGKKPFNGKSTNDVLTAILKQEPIPVSTFKSGNTTGLHYIISRAMRKNRDERYSSMPEMIRDLRMLKNEVAMQDMQNRRANSVSFSEPGAAVFPLPSRSGNSKAVKSGRPISKVKSSRAASSRGKSLLTSAQSQFHEMARTIFPGNMPRTPSKVEWQILESRGTVAKPPRRRGRASAFKKTLPITALVLGTLTIVVGCLYLFRQQPQPFRNWQFNRFAIDARVVETAISADGRLVAYSQAEAAGKEGLWLRSTGSGKPIVIIPSRDVAYRGIQFSDDGTSLFFLVKETKAPFRSALYQKAVDGESLKKLPVQAEPGFDVSADAASVAFIRDTQNGQRDLFTADLATGREQQITRPGQANSYSSRETAWEEDGEWIACGRTVTGADGGRYSRLVAVKVKDGVERPLSNRNWASISRILWLKDEQGLVIVASEKAQTQEQIWHIIPGLAEQQISNDPQGFKGLSISSDGRLMMTTRTKESMDIWVAPAGNLAGAWKVTRGGGEYYAPSWAPDGNIITDSGPMGAAGLWKLTPDGKRVFKITGGEQKNLSPIVTPDNRYLIVQSIRNGRMNLWSSKLGDNTTVQLTRGENDRHPRLSPDGAWVLYESQLAGKWSIWKVPVQGGNPEAVLAEPRSHYSWPAFSPDGKWMAVRQTTLDLNQSRILVYPTGSQQLANSFDLSATQEGPLEWAADGQGVSYIDNRTGSSEIWLQPVAGGLPKQLTQLGADRIRSFSWSPDGKLISLTRVTQRPEAVLASRPY
jgi:serine/threonine protein kinase/Tol biopolymer transport system component